MNVVDIVLAVAIGAVLFFALRRTIRTRKSGGCGCGCPGCTGSCPSKRGGRK